MARIPEFTRQVLLDRAQPSNIESAFAINGGNQARAIYQQIDSQRENINQLQSFSNELTKQRDAAAEVRTYEVYNDFERRKIIYDQEQRNSRMANPDGFQKSADEWFLKTQNEIEETSANDPDGRPFNRELFRRLSDRSRTEFMNSASDWENGMRLKNVFTGIEKNIDQDAVNFSLQNPSLRDLPKQLQKSRDYVNSAGAKVVDPAQQQKLFEYSADKNSEVVLSSMLQNKPEVLKDVMLYGAGTQDQIISFVADELEGGEKFVPDGKGFAKFGINSAANNIAPEELKNMTRDQAVEIYKGRYWDKRLDDMTPAMKAVAFDALVNHGNDADTWRMIEQSGNDPAVLIQLRREEYARLVAANPEKYAQNAKGWENRLNKLAGFSDAMDDNAGGGSDFLKHAGLINPNLINRTIAQIPSAIAAKQRAEQAQTAQRVSVFNAEFKRLNSTMLNNLEPIGQQEIDQLKEIALASGDQDAIAQAETLSESRNYISALRNMNEQDINGEIRRLSASINKGTAEKLPVDGLRYQKELAENVLKGQIEGIKNDGLAYYGKTGLVRMPAQLDYSALAQEGGVEALQQELNLRQESVAYIRQNTGNDLTVMTPDEIQQMQGLIEKLPSNEVAGTLRIFDNLTPENRNRLSETINKTSPFIATAMNVPDLTARRRILEGSKTDLMADKTMLDAEISAIIEPMVVDNQFLQDSKKVLAGYYAALSKEQMDTSPSVDTKRLQTAITDVYGPVVDVGGASLFSFKDPQTNDFVDEDELYDVFNDFNDDDLVKLLGKAPVSSKGRTIKAKELKMWSTVGRFVSAGDGVYNFVARDGGLLMDYNAKGGQQPIEFDGREMLKIHRKRKGN
jgi:hypothetical protein